MSDPKRFVARDEGRRRARESGVRFGRRPELPEEVEQRMRAERASGASVYAITKGLNEDKVPTAHGGARWYESTVHKVLDRTGGDPLRRRSGVA